MKGAMGPPRNRARATRRVSADLVRAGDLKLRNDFSSELAWRKQVAFVSLIPDQVRNRLTLGEFH